MKNYAKQQWGTFCPRQTFTIGSKSHALRPHDIDHFHITGTDDFTTPILEFKYYKTPINSWENDSN